MTWRVWVPVFIVNFSVTPLWLRVPFVRHFSIIFGVLHKENGEFAHDFCAVSIGNC